MCGSGVLDTVIGVVFVFLLVSLLVTTGNGPGQSAKRANENAALARSAER